MSSKQIQDVEEIGKMLQIDIIGLNTNNVNSIEKATENLKDVPEESSLTGVKEDSKITGIKKESLKEETSITEISTEIKEEMMFENPEYI